MSFRTSLQRLTRRDPAAPSLRQRLAFATANLAETKERAGKAVEVARILMQPPELTPAPVDRAALVNYATFLALERERVCAELYPHMGAQASRFVLMLNAAERFFYPEDSANDHRSDAWKRVPPPSVRAVKVLDLVGIDWREDTDKNSRRFFDEAGRADTGERPEMPYGWPTPDAALLEALDDLNRLDAAQNAMYAPGSRREGDRVPGYDALEEARSGALDQLAETRAESLIGLQAKARALLTRSVVDIAGAGDDIAKSLARDLLGARQSTIEPRPDPVLTAIDECRRLDAIHGAALAVSGSRPDDDPSHGPERDAYEALWTHWDAVMLKTVPITARGCAALARYAVEFLTEQGLPEHRDEILSLIARSPLL